MIEAVKQAEDGPELIVRLYEFENCRTQASLKLGQPAKNIWLCNLMEEPERLLGAGEWALTGEGPVLMLPPRSGGIWRVGEAEPAQM